MKNYTIERQSSSGTLSYYSSLYSENAGHAMFAEFRIAAKFDRNDADSLCSSLNSDSDPDVWGFRVVENTNK